MKHIQMFAFVFVMLFISTDAFAKETNPEFVEVNSKYNIVQNPKTGNCYQIRKAKFPSLFSAVTCEDFMEVEESNLIDPVYTIKDSVEPVSNSEYVSIEDFAAYSRFDTVMSDIEYNNDQKPFDPNTQVAFDKKDVIAAKCSGVSCTVTIQLELGK